MHGRYLQEDAVAKTRCARQSTTDSIYEVYQDSASAANVTLHNFLVFIKVSQVYIENLAQGFEHDTIDAASSETSLSGVHCAFGQMYLPS
eukprot:scaffold2461_cov160-Pinguiococcus_pyrenoidosus.AAC.2